MAGCHTYGHEIRMMEELDSCVMSYQNPPSRFGDIRICVSQHELIPMAMVNHAAIEYGLYRHRRELIRISMSVRFANPDIACGVMVQVDWGISDDIHGHISGVKRVLQGRQWKKPKLMRFRRVETEGEGQRRRRRRLRKEESDDKET